MIRPGLLAAYRNTIYQVGDVRIRIGHRSDAMDRLLVRHGTRQAALISAYNPFSTRKPPGWNRRMHARLAETMRIRMVLPATGSWRHWSEAHFLVFGDPRPIARLARQFRQNAIVIIRVRQPAYLLVA